MEDMEMIESIEVPTDIEEYLANNYKLKILVYLTGIIYTMIIAWALYNDWHATIFYAISLISQFCVVLFFYKQNVNYAETKLELYLVTRELNKQFQDSGIDDYVNYEEDDAATLNMSFHFVSFLYAMVIFSTIAVIYKLMNL